MISLKRIVEQYGTEGQFYDLGRDFSNFRRVIDGNFDQIKQRFEQTIGSQLNGKRIKARASRGYKQYVKDYEFDVSKITLDDYYDNYVVVAHDYSTPKPKEYFLKPGFKIQVLGPASGQPASDDKKNPVQKPGSPSPDIDKAQSQPMTPVGNPSIKEAENSDKKSKGVGHFDAYPIDTIEQDVKDWLVPILIKPEESVRDFIPGLGWLKDLGYGKSMALFDLKISTNKVKITLTDEVLQKLLHSSDKRGTIDITYDLVKTVPNKQNEEILVRVKKTMIDKSAI